MLWEFVFIMKFLVWFKVKEWRGLYFRGYRKENKEDKFIPIIFVVIFFLGFIKWLKFRRKFRWRDKIVFL